MARAIYEEFKTDPTVDHEALFHIQDAAYHLSQAYRRLARLPPYPPPERRALHFSEWLEQQIGINHELLQTLHPRDPVHAYIAQKIGNQVTAKSLILEWFSEIPPHLHAIPHYYPY